VVLGSGFVDSAAADFVDCAIVFGRFGLFRGRCGLMYQGNAGDWRLTASSERGRRGDQKRWCGEGSIKSTKRVKRVKSIKNDRRELMSKMHFGCRHYFGSVRLR